MKELPIVFMGTPEFAVASLDRLVEGGYNVVGVVTAADKPAGRGRKLQQSAVKQYALEKGIPVLQPQNLKSEEFLESLRQLGAKLQVVVAFRMLPREVWSMPEYGTFNLHASLLPDYRGAAPINWAVIKGEKETGVTTFFIDDKIDTGAILLQEAAVIGSDETAGELHDRLMTLGAGLVIRTVDLIAAGKAVARPQGENSGLKTAPKLNKDNCRIQWDQPLVVIYNQIRGLSPYPAAWTVLNNGKDIINMKIYKAKPLKTVHNLEPGEIVAGREDIKVAVPGGYIDLLEIQLAGKRRLEVKEVLNGLHLEENASLS
jgi:methionyl-tRNA formyltransferase